MANFICEFEGVRGRSMRLYNNKIVISTKITVGSIMTGNMTDGEKTIFLSDIVGIQFKKSGAIIGYLQFETPSAQMNNISDNMFSENTFTYEEGKNGITNNLMTTLYNFICDRMEEIKYGITIINEVPDFESKKVYYATKDVKSVDYNDDTCEDNFQKWEQIITEYGSVSGRCEMCGVKKKNLVYSEFEDIFGKAQRNLCFDCFFNHNAIAKKY